MKRERMVVKESTSKDELEASAARLLLLTGVPANMNGYRYLLTSVMLVCQDDQLIGAITTRLYPVVAKMHGVTKTRVERSIRNRPLMRPVARPCGEDEYHLRRASPACHG